MADSVIQVRGAAPDEIEQVLRLDTLAFQGREATAEEIEKWLPYVQADPGYDPAHWRVLPLDGRFVSQCEALPYTMYYGQSTLTVGGVGSVGTDPDYRRRGYAGAVMRDAVDYMTGLGCDLSLLGAGAPDYYDRFGYTNIFALHRLDVDPKDIAGLTSALTVRPLTEADIPAMQTLYEREWRGRPGARVRTPDYLAWKLRNPDARHVGAVDATGRLRGYALPSWWADVVAADTEATIALLLDSAAQITEEGEKVHWGAPPDSPTARCLEQVCPYTVTQSVRRNAGWMGRVLNLHSTLEKLVPELEARLNRSQYADQTGSVRFETDLGQATLAFRKGQLGIANHARTSPVARIDQQVLIALLFAYRTPVEVATWDGTQIDAEAIPILEALFPPRMCYLSQFDWF